MVFNKKKKKTSQRRSQFKKEITSERKAQLSKLINAETILSILMWALTFVITTFIISFDYIKDKNYQLLIPLAISIIFITVGGAVYIINYQKRILRNYTRAFTLIGILALLLATTKIGLYLWPEQLWWVTATTITAAMVLSIAYDQRFALGMSAMYAILACFSAGEYDNLKLFLLLSTGVFTCCFSLKEIRTRVKLLQVSAMAALFIFIMSCCMEFLSDGKTFSEIAMISIGHSLVTIFVGMIIQALLPLIEKTFKVATSMTLLDYSDANQPLLKRLAMEAPGTYSHSLLVGQIAEAAAEAIGRNGLLCRVGAYYHDIGKINKPSYFVENEMGSKSRHKELSPTMSQLVIVGHVKDGVEMAKEYGLPAVLRQFIETHHGTTLIEYFYNEAKKKKNDKQTPPSESEFRYAGPMPKTKEAAIVMLVDASEGAVRSLKDITATKIETVVHNMAMKRLQDGQFDECDLTLRELSEIESSIAKSLAAHYHGRIAYPTKPDEPVQDEKKTKQNQQQSEEQQNEKSDQQPANESSDEQKIINESNEKAMREKDQ